MEHTLHYLMLPGQIENWVVIVDLDKLSISDLPRKVMKRLIQCFQDSYKSRLARMVMVNATTWTKILWGIISAFVDPQTNVKIKLHKSKNPPVLNQLIHPDQLPQRFGGNAPEVTKFW